jgi:hypothetical protein
LILGPGAEYPHGGLNAFQNEGYNAEVESQQPGLCNGAAGVGPHYGMQFMVHDGDQTGTGGDVGRPARLWLCRSR